jgi:hypothetical protein
MTFAVLTGTTALAIPVLAIPVTAAGATGRVAPGQYFNGVVNGVDGNTVTPITIQMGCFGPVVPGATGHPLPGQTLAVHQLFPPTAGSGLGKTGDDARIGVFFGAPPPGGSAPGPAAGSVTFSHYDRTKPLPTTVTLPCSGTGTVWFTPIPVTPPSRSQAVPVRFVGQP